MDKLPECIKYISQFRPPSWLSTVLLIFLGCKRLNHCITKKDLFTKKASCPVWHTEYKYVRDNCCSHQRGTKISAPGMVWNVIPANGFELSYHQNTKMDMAWIKHVMQSDIMYIYETIPPIVFFKLSHFFQMPIVDFIENLIVLEIRFSLNKHLYLGRFT